MPELSEQIAAIRAHADHAPPRERSALLAAAETIDAYGRLRMSASEALEIRRIDDAKLSAAMERAQRP